MLGPSISHPVSRMLTARRFSLSARSGCAANGSAGKKVAEDNKMKHEVEMKSDHLGVERGGIELKVSGDGSSIGTLSISNGTVKWYPKNLKKKCALFSWEEFNDNWVAD